MIAYHTNMVNNYVEQLSAYLAANGKYPDKEEDPPLHDWVLTQRHLYKAGLLEKEMIHELNSMGFIWNKKEARWYEKAALIKKLLKEDKTAFFSGRSVKLFRWLDDNLGRLRSNALQAGKIPRMKEIQALLSAVNLPDTVMGVAKKVKTQCVWMANFNDLVEFRKANPTTWPQLSATCRTERRLARWCIEMRYLYKRNTLSKEWIDKLETLSFNFK